MPQEVDCAACQVQQIQEPCSSGYSIPSRFAMRNVAVLGIRPQHIKAATLSRNLCNGLRESLVHTGQDFHSRSVSMRISD
jgi:hypothetical protein